jgi:hypothetical protein
MDAQSVAARRALQWGFETACNFIIKLSIELSIESFYRPWAIPLSQAHGAKPAKDRQRCRRDRAEVLSTGRSMLLELIDFSHDSRGLIFQSRALRSVVFLGVFAGVIFEIQVAEILVENIFLFTEKVQARLRPLPLDVAFGIKDISEDREKKKAAADGAHS